MQPTYRRWWLVLPLIIMIALVLITAPPAHAAEATLDTIQVKPGGTLSLRASGFGAREVVNSWVSGTDGSVFPTENGVSTQGGAVYLTIRIGRFWQPGWWAITILGSESGSKAIATFEIIPAPPDGTLATDRAQVFGGEHINARGTGFAPAEVVKAWVTLPDGTATAIASELRADRNGDVYLAYDVPASAAPGTWYITAYGTESQRLLVGSWAVLGR
jgi:hypothetical protein